MVTRVGVSAAARVWLLGVVGVLLGSILVALPAAAAPASAARQGPAVPAVTGPSAEVAAMAAARSGGRRVEVPSRRSETAQVFANPNGTWTLEQYAVPVRVRQPSGGWAPVDTSLRVAADGTLQPVATVSRIEFSAGGPGPLVRMGTRGGEVVLSWPWPLPAPTVQGDTAVYAEVLAGVDLRVRALADGFTHVLVVKSREAALQPGLRRIQYRLSGGGLRVGVGAGGGLEVVDGRGRVVASGEAPLMWDSARPSGSAGPMGSARPAPVGDVSSPIPPGDGARQRVPAVSVSGDQVTLTPDPGLLADRTTVFPLFIDPPVTLGVSAWGYADQANESRTDGIARVGLNPDGTGLWRSFFSYNISGLGGKAITSAVFRTKLIHSWSCGSTPVNLYRVGSRASGRVNWAGPALTKWLDVRSGHAHKPTGGAGCSDDPQPDMTMEFGNLLRGELQGATNARLGEFHLALSARDGDGTNEGDQNRWKKFSPGDSKLSVVYESYPRVPDQLTTSGNACVTGAGRPVVGQDPTLSAHFFDDDGGNLTASFHWAHVKADGTYESETALPAVTVANNQVKAVQLTGLADAQSYAWRVQATDSTSRSSAWSGWCELTVDAQRPGTPPKVSSPLYVDDGLTHGGVGQTGPFTFAANGTTDVTSYRWGWNDPPTTNAPTSAPGGSVTLDLTPPPPFPNDPTSFGDLTLYVRSVDGVGNVGPAAHYTFRVGSAAVPKGDWGMGDCATGVLSGSSAYPATLGGGAACSTLQRVPSQPVVAFNGTTAAATTSGPVVTAKSGSSFTVSAWARPASASTTWRGVVSQDGTRTSGFSLAYIQNVGWAFTMIDSDTDTPMSTRVTAPAVVGVWTHLVGVYDSGAFDATGKGRMRLYVNGALAATAPYRATWDPAGALAIGRDKWRGSSVDFFNGDVDDVKVWQRVLADVEIRDIATAPVGAWSFDEGSSPSLDASGYGRDASWKGNAASGVGPQCDPSLQLDGAAYASTSGPVVRTDQSFTVAAWVRLDTLPTGTATAVSQDSGDPRALVSGFYLGYRTDAGPRWYMRMYTSPGTPLGEMWQVSAGSPVAGRWTHLVGVYDRAAGQLRLYVDGARVGAAPAGAAWHASGPLAIGRGPSSTSGPTLSWSNEIDDLRVWPVALSDAGIAALYNPPTC